MFLIGSKQNKILHMSIFTLFRQRLIFGNAKIIYKIVLHRIIVLQSKRPKRFIVTLW